MNRFSWFKCIISVQLGILMLLFALPAMAEQSPVTDSYLRQINALFKQNNVALGHAELDAHGRVILKGTYADEQEVARAFSLAQTVVGIKWVSPVTPENITVKEWERQSTSIFKRSRVVDASGDSPPGPVRNRYAIVVGVGQFRYGVKPLQYAVRDAQSFYGFLTQPGRSAFLREHIIFLTDQQATRANIANAFDQIKKVAQPDDLVVFYMSSHGSPPDWQGGVGLVTYDTEVTPRERVWHTSINTQMLKDFADGLRAKRLVMILDTCHSNGAFNKIPGFLPPGGKSLGAGDNEGYGISKAQGKKVLGGSKDIIVDDMSSPRRAPSSKNLNMDDGWGKVLVAASTGEQRSWESDRLKQSFFTYYFVDGLRKNNGSIQNAFYYAKPKVTEQVRIEKEGEEQTPQIMATKNNWDMKLAKPR